jgi:hypothetical protein
MGNSSPLPSCCSSITVANPFSARNAGLAGLVLEFNDRRCVVEITDGLRSYRSDDLSSHQVGLRHRRFAQIQLMRDPQSIGRSSDHPKFGVRPRLPQVDATHH